MFPSCAPGLPYLRKFREHSVATALASRVLPVPGGPYRSTPDGRGGREREGGRVVGWKGRKKREGWTGGDGKGREVRGGEGGEGGEGRGGEGRGEERGWNGRGG